MAAALNAAILAFPDVYAVLTVCGCSNVQFMALNTQQSITTLDIFGTSIGYDNVTEMVKEMGKVGLAQGGVRISRIVTNNLIALAYWIKDRQRRNVPRLAEEFTADAMRNAYTQYELLVRLRKADVSDQRPKPFDPSQWVTWSKQFESYLSVKYGAFDAPVDYVIREHEFIPIGFHAASDAELLRNQLPVGLIGGAYFTSDNELVFQELQSLMFNTDGHEWIQQFRGAKDGRAAWGALKRNYEGTAQVNNAVTTARRTLESLFYRDERAYSFASFTTKAQNAFTTLSDYGRAVREDDKVRWLAEKVKNPALEAAVEVMVTAHAENYEEAVAHLSSVVVRKATQPAMVNRSRKPANRYISAASTGGRGRGRGDARSGGRNSGGRGGRGQGRGGRSQGSYNSGRGSHVTMVNGEPTVNGVNVSDPTRNFTNPEFRALGDYKSTIFQQRAERGGGGRSVSSVYAGHGQAGTEISEVTEPTATGARGSQNGVRFGRGAYNNQAQS